MRKTFAIVVFYFYMTAAAVLLEVTGLTAAWGVESPTNVTNAAAETADALRNIDTSGGIFDTLIAVFATTAGTVETMGSAVFALPIFLASMGIPEPFLVFLFAPAVVIVGRDILHAISGRFA